MSLADSKAFQGFAANDMDAVRKFYGETLGLKTSDQDDLLVLNLAGDRDAIIYPKPDFEPATYTILNFPVSDVEAAVDELTSRGVAFERYDGMDQDEKGIHRGEGPVIAWFKDPVGNILAVLEIEE